MADPVQKRRSRAGIEPDRLVTSSPGEPLGGRRPPAGPGHVGGGYQGTRTAPNVLALPGASGDAHLDELRAMGLPRLWLRVAELIGVEAFLTMWRTLDADPAAHGDRGDLEVRLRPFRSYLRYQRNRYIEALAGANLDVKEIRARVEAELGESISPRHIARIGQRARVER